MLPGVSLSRTHQIVPGALVAEACMDIFDLEELEICPWALREGVIAPTINYDAPDPDCDLDVVPNVAREREVRAVMSNAFAFGGLNAVLVLQALR